MTREEVLEFVSGNPVFFLATVQGRKPHVRGMMLYCADEDGLVFCTDKAKDLYKQLGNNPAVEMCFYDPRDVAQVRVSGKVTELDDLELKKQVVAKFVFLKPWIDHAGYDAMAVFRLAGGKAVSWAMGAGVQPKQEIEL